MTAWRLAQPRARSRELATAVEPRENWLRARLKGSGRHRTRRPANPLLARRTRAGADRWAEA